ncbi:MAG TPA: zinc ribbon domain-containing protein [Longilinea sp.]|nr:zinc ribbon domain-containing protein [Longilinea sp.]
MADIRCSNCQTLNPADATLCKNCGQPLLDESISWLDDLRGGSESAAWEETETAAKANQEAQPNEDIPEWLQRIRQRSQTEPEKTGQVSPTEGSTENQNDWLSNVQQTATDSAASSAPSADDDWLQSLRSSKAPVGDEPSGTLVSSLDRLSSEETQADLPDWMANLEPLKSGAEEKPDELLSASSTDWASRFGEEEPPTGTPGAPVDDTQDWLSRFSQPTDGLNSEPGANEDWLAGLQAATGSLAGANDAEISPAGEETDWMSSLRNPDLPGEAQLASLKSEESSTGEKESLSWESELPADLPVQEQTAETADWLKKFDSDEPPSNEDQSISPIDSERSGETPDWLSSISDQETEQPAAPVEGEPSIEPGDESQAVPAESVPDWLKNYTPDEKPEPPVEPVAPISEEPQEAGFSWQSLSIPAEASLVNNDESDELSPFATANLPDWLNQEDNGSPRLPYDEQLIPQPDSTGSSGGQSPFTGSDLGEWLDESSLATPAIPAGGSQPATGGDQPLEAAEMPTWLQSMRPIEMVAPKQTPTEEKHVEKAGPLAGLTGVLPTEDLVGQYIKPPIYSVKLRVSEKQRVHASLIESLISDETQAQLIPADRGETPRRILRILVAVLLMLVIILPMLNLLPALPASDILPQELVAFEQIMSDESILAQGSPVLLAVEYEPGLSGEMQTASEAVIKQLSNRGIRLTIIATSPTGPILAQSLIEKAGYQSDQVVNLGYLAGGSTGLQSFSMAPAQAAPATLQGALASWNKGVLAGVSSLKDFAAVIVLTDDPDKGRNWVEQVQPALASKPLLMISSAQAAPLLLPYYNSGQVKGIITGISGAAGYEGLIQSKGTATLLRTPYQYAMLLTALLILVGGLVSSIITSIARGKAEKEA